MITVGIDASNISSGGGVTHLVELMGSVDIKQKSIKKIEVWAPKKILEKLPQKNGLVFKNHMFTENNVIKRIYWQRLVLTKYAKDNYDILFVPGGSYLGSFRPVVTMNRNLLPFDEAERKRYRFTLQAVRMNLLKAFQSHTYNLADGVIFLSEEAKRLTEQQMSEKITATQIIPHGIADKFFNEPRPQKAIESYNHRHPFRFLYVSTVTVYKHQWHVIEAIGMLREKGYPVVLDLVGSVTTRRGKQLFEKACAAHDPKQQFVNYHGRKNHEEVLEHYHNADGFIFASSCETFGQVLLEAMASGLPIGCSNRSAMPEILRDAGLYFDPEDPKNISQTLKKMIDSASLRQAKAEAAYSRAGTYSWEKCADKTFNFINQVSERHNKR